MVFLTEEQKKANKKLAQAKNRAKSTPKAKEEAQTRSDLKDAGYSQSEIDNAMKDWVFKSPAVLKREAKKAQIAEVQAETEVALSRALEQYNAGTISEAEWLEGRALTRAPEDERRKQKKYRKDELKEERKEAERLKRAGEIRADPNFEEVPRNPDNPDEEPPMTEYEPGFEQDGFVYPEQPSIPKVWNKRLKKWRRPMSDINLNLKAVAEYMAQFGIVE